MSIIDNAAAITERNDRRMGKLLEEIPTLMDDTTKGINNKYFSLVKIADEAIELIAPNAPCKKGCSYCCKIAVAISQREADRIGEHIGRGASKVSPHTPAENVQRFNGKPCTFLAEDGSCEIYEVRPLVCRTHHVVEDTPDKCDVEKNSGGNIASINLNIIDMAAAYLMFSDRTATFGDIRDYFPRAVKP